LISNLYNQLLRDYLSRHDFARIVQIGANDGRINDPIYEVVNNYKNSTAIFLIEPQSDVIPFLRINYQNHPNCIIVNAAIGPEKTLLIYRLRKDLWDQLIRNYLQDAPSYRVPTGFASNVKDHVLGHIRGKLLIDNNEVEVLEQISSPSFHLLRLLDKYQFKTPIDILQIDCEGMDDEVIYCCNLEVTAPNIINFEYCHLPYDRLEKLKLYFCDNGYLTINWSNSDAIAIKRDSALINYINAYR
jgi:FkbM family methyltransferase